ncbi:MAG TPA: glycosyltransferase family 4 protein [Thermoanaerobaculia bacterium]
MPQRAPRLCLLFPHLHLGGGETATLLVAERLRETFDLSVCALAGENNEAPTLADELAARFDRVAVVAGRGDLYPHLQAADVVLWYGVVGAVPKALARLPHRPASVRVVHTDRDLDGVLFHRRYGAAIDATICVVPEVARQIPGAVFVANAADPSRLQGERQTLFPASSAKTLGFLGRLVPQKNVAWLIESLAAAGCNLALQALDTPLQTTADLRALAARHGVLDRVRFLPPGRDVGTLLKSVDALVVASRHEGFPMVVIEAGTVGTPAIATRVGALPELFGDDVLWLDGDAATGTPTIDSLRRALGRLDPAWGRRLQARVERLCDPQVVAARASAVLHGALAARRAPAA